MPEDRMDDLKRSQEQFGERIQAWRDQIRSESEATRVNVERTLAEQKQRFETNMSAVQMATELTFWGISPQSFGQEKIAATTAQIEHLKAEVGNGNAEARQMLAKINETLGKVGTKSPISLDWRPKPEEK